MKIAKIFGITLAALVALVIVAVAVVATVFDPNDYKDEVAALVESRTGRSLALDGDLELSYFPWLAVTTRNVTLGNAPGFGPEPFASIERAAVRVKLMPLFERRVEVGTIELDGLVLNLARDADGNTNWDDVVARFRADDTAEPADGAGADSAGADTAGADAATPATPVAQSLELAGVRLRDGAVRWREAGEARFVVDGLEVSTGPIAGRAPVTAEIEGAFRDVRSGTAVTGALAGAVGLGEDGVVEVRGLETALAVALPNRASRSVDATVAAAAYDPAAATVALQGLSATAAGASLTGDVAVAGLDAAARVTAGLTLDAASLGDLLAALDWPAPEGMRPEALGRVTARADVELETDPQVVRVANVEAELLGLALRGAGELRGGRELAGSIEIPEAATSAPFRELLRRAVPPTVDTAAIERFGLAARFETDLETGRASLRDLDLRTLGTRVQGTIEAEPGANGNVFRGSIATSRFAAEPFVRAFRELVPAAIDARELGDLRLDTRFVFDTAADTLTLTPFTAEVFGLTGSGEIRATKVTSAAAWSGRLEVAEFSPQALITRFGLPPQPTSDEKALTRARITTRFNATAENGRFEDIVLALDDSRITGNFAVLGFKDPRYEFTLAVDAVDADRYLPPPSGEAADGERTAGEIELPENNTMRLDGTMTIGALRLAGMQFADVGARILIGDGNLALENARARLYGGRFDGSFRVRASGDEPGLALAGKAADVDLATLIEALTGGPANVSGTGSFDVDLAGSGRKIIDNVATAGGNVAFSMRNGTIQGFNLGRSLCAAWNLKERAAAPPQRPDETRYELIQGTAVVQNGVARTRDLLARTSFMDITGGGTLVLTERQLDYEVDAKLTGKIDIPNCSTMDDLVGNSIPFTIKGPIDGPPTILPDFSKIVRQAIQNRLEDAVRDRLRDLLN